MYVLLQSLIKPLITLIKTTHIYLAVCYYVRVENTHTNLHPRNYTIDAVRVRQVQLENRKRH